MEGDHSITLSREALAALLDGLLRGERGPVRTRAYALAVLLLADHDPDERNLRANVILRSGQVHKLWELAVNGASVDDEEGDETREAA